MTATLATLGIEAHQYFFLTPFTSDAPSLSPIFFKGDRDDFREKNLDFKTCVIMISFNGTGMKSNEDRKYRYRGRDSKSTTACR